MVAMILMQPILQSVRTEVRVVAATTVTVKPQ